MVQVSLLSMPFGSLERPSIALGILKAGLQTVGLSARVHYTGFLFADNFFSNYSSELLIGEWVFSKVVFPDFKKDDNAYIRFCEKSYVNLNVLMYARDAAEEFIEEVAAGVLEDDPVIVGCSSVFQQHCSSLAVLKRIKEKRPHIVTVMGGANCEGTMGRAMHRLFTWVDYVVSGEADDEFPALCKKIVDCRLRSDSPISSTGILSPQHRTAATNEHAFKSVRIDDMDSLPIPDYDDYFRTLANASFRNSIEPALLIETSRGCWWGQQKPCAFCSLTGETNRFRSKSPDRVESEFSYLTQKYHINKIELVDNIFNMEYFTTLLPRLSHAPAEYIILLETKSNLQKRHLKSFRDAGVRWVQSGIESLHNDVLAKLNKGNTWWGNIQLLKWAMQHSIYVIWNFLYNIPNEEDSWYREMAEWLPLICHLQPPTGTTAIRFDRFSEFFRQQKKHNVDLTAYWTYDYVYPLKKEELDEMAYYFVNTNESTETRPGLTAFFDIISEWQKLFFSRNEHIIQKRISDDRPKLTMHVKGATIGICDTRPCAVVSVDILEGVAAEIYRTCEIAQTKELLLASIRKRYDGSVTWNHVRRIVDILCEKKLMLSINDHYLSLAVEEEYDDYMTFDHYPGGFVYLERTDEKEVPSDPFEMSLEDAFGLKMHNEKYEVAE